MRGSGFSSVVVGLLSEVSVPGEDASELPGSGVSRSESLTFGVFVVEPVDGWTSPWTFSCRSSGVVDSSISRGGVIKPLNATADSDSIARTGP